MGGIFGQRRGRRGVSGPDPVGEALRVAAAGGPLVRRIDDAQPDLGQLVQWFQVEESDDLDGFDTVVAFDDEIHAYADPGDDGLDLALADQRGIKDVHQEDREVIFLRTRLHLDDVRAAVVRAVVDVNRRPRRRPEPAGMVTKATAVGIADQVAPLLEHLGFERMTGEYDRTRFQRHFDNGVVQGVNIAPAGDVVRDGVSLAGKIWIITGVKLPVRHPPGPDDWRVDAGGWTLCHQAHVAPTVPAVEHSLRAESLPWLEGTAGRDAVARWASEDPERIDTPWNRAKVAQLLAGWGYHDEARRLRDHPVRRNPRRY